MNTKHLKAKILDLAIRGKLVEQKAEDGNAFDLLQKIREEKKACHGEALAETSTKKMSHGLDFANAKSELSVSFSRTDAGISSASDVPFEIPENWCWCRLGEICKLISGQDVESKFYNSEQKGIPYITGASNFEKEKIIINRWTETPKTLALKNDLLITCKGTVGKLAFLNEEKAHIARQIMAIRPFEEINRSI